MMMAEEEGGFYSQVNREHCDEAKKPLGEWSVCLFVLA